MKEETITFKNESGGKGDFVSIHPEKDSLEFQGETAFYDLKTNELQIGGVEVIQKYAHILSRCSGRLVRAQ